MLSACTGVHNHPYAYISGMLIMFLSFFFIGSTSQDQRIGNHLGVFWEMITWRGQSSRTGTDRVTVTNQMIAVIMISCRINVVPRESHPSNVWEALHVYGALMSWWCHFYWRLGYMYMYVKWMSGHSKTVFQYGSNLTLSLPGVQVA